MSDLSVGMSEALPDDELGDDPLGSRPRDAGRRDGGRDAGYGWIDFDDSDSPWLDDQDDAGDGPASRCSPAECDLFGGFRLRAATSRPSVTSTPTTPAAGRARRSFSPIPSSPRRRRTHRRDRRQPDRHGEVRRPDDEPARHPSPSPRFGSGSEPEHPASRRRAYRGRRPSATACPPTPPRPCAESPDSRSSGHRDPAAHRRLRGHRACRSVPPAGARSARCRHDRRQCRHRSPMRPTRSARRGARRSRLRAAADAVRARCARGPITRESPRRRAS